MNSPVAFRFWLPKKVRPLAIAAGLIGLTFGSISLGVSARDSIERWDAATQTWARSAEILISKRDISTLDAVTEFLRHDYPSVQVGIRDNSTPGRILWSYPEGGFDSFPKANGFLWRSIPLNTDSGLIAEVHVQWRDVIQVVIWTIAIVLGLTTLAFLSFYTIFKYCINRIVNEVVRVKQGSDSEVQELVELVVARENSEKERAKTEGQAALGALAAQVAHDIQSPLAAMDMVLEDLTNLPEDLRLMVRGAVGRIRDISNNLLENNRKKYLAQSGPIKNEAHEETASVLLLSSLVDPLISEKRMQYRTKIGLDIQANLNSSYGLFAEIQSTEFKRVLSNLINNAAEALVDQGKITLTVEEKDERIEIRCTDSGKGISPDILVKLTQRGETHGKEGGSGLGLYHARISAEKWSGTLKIESQVGQGTSVAISLPKASAPAWFVPELVVMDGTTVVVLDDDTSIHQIWAGRFEKILAPSHRVRLKHCSTGDEFSNCVRSNGSQSPFIYLVDYELLGEAWTGLDLIERLGIGNQSILVTSRFEEEEIKRRCEMAGVRLIPKGLAAFVPITLLKDTESPRIEAVFVDDNPINRTLWERVAKRSGVNLKTFNDPEDLLNIALDLDQSIPLFFDSELAQNKKGEVESKIFYDLGFRNIYLATGYDPEAFPDRPWIKGVLGKNFPKELFTKVKV